MKKIKGVSLCVTAVLLILSFMSVSVFAFDNSGWYWPVPDSLYMSRGYSDGHNGLDIISTRDVNEKVVAARAGTVIAVYEGCNKWNGYGQNHGGCNPVAHLTTGDKWGIRKYQSDGGTDVCNYGIGNGVVIDHGGGVWTEYAHMASVNVSVGQSVTGGYEIGTMGSYGNSTGRHLHFSIKTNSYMSTGGYPNGTAVNNNAYGPEYIINGSWNGVDNIWYSRDYPSSNGTLDVNGRLDGANNDGLGDFGTCDVYINGSRVADDVTDYFTAWPAGTSYEVKDIKAKSGYSYDGNSSYSGTITSGAVADVRLTYSSCRLDINGMLDGSSSGKLDDYGTVDVYINGSKVADDVNDYYSLAPKGATYEIKDIKATDGYKYEKVVTGSLTGTIGSGTKTVVLEFYTEGIATSDWTYSDVLPKNITSDYCDIEYKNFYESIATTSPGSGWTNNGVAREEWQNSGNVYSSPRDLETSDARILVSSKYYHFCGPNAGNEGNYELSGNFVHYDAIDASRVTAEYLGDDNGHPYYFVYLDGSRLWCQSGVTCDGSWGSHGKRCQAWYKNNEYQDRVKVTYYRFTKESGWTTQKDSSAKTVKYRYKLKDTEMPVINRVKVTEITPYGYTILCEASDDSGIMKMVASTWTDTETEANAKINEAVPETMAGSVEMTVTIPVTDHGNERDVNYNTKITVYDKVGNTTEYAAEDIKVYIATLVRSARKLNLPADLTEIEEGAFEESIAFGEVLIPDGTEKIGSRAFADCSRLVFVSIPDSVTEISDDAFDGSSNTVILCSVDSETEAFAKRNKIPYFTDIRAD